jgi:hypothetical protein
MKIQLDQSIFTELQGVSWLQECGRELPRNLIGVKGVLDEKEALGLLRSDNWEDARTEAQGDLTGYLSKYHYDAYGGYWNKLAKEATTSIEKVALDGLHCELQRRGWPVELVKPIVVDLTRAILEISYRAQFKKAPAFFTTVLEIYKSGHLPCGWSGNLSEWPAGSIIAY